MLKHPHSGLANAGANENTAQLNLGTNSASLEIAGFGSAAPRESTCRPLVTIAIPTFNRASWLKDCVLSALSQTYQNVEILVSDNASTDETQQVLKEFSDKRLRVVRQETNVGLLRNWNACLAGAKGDYVVFLSDDDRLAPWLLERCIGLVQQEPQVPIVIALSSGYSPLADRTWPPTASRYLETGIWDGTDILLEYLKDEIVIHMCSVMLRTETLRAQGGFPLDLPHAADFAACARLLLQGKAGLINEACATHYSHDTNETARLGVEQLLLDGWRVVDLISDLADNSINDLQRRHDVRTQSRRCYARRGLRILASYRANGGRSLEVAGLLWRHRRNLSHLNMESLFDLRWQFAIILCWRQMTWFRRLKQFVGVGRRERLQDTKSH